ncbi:MAG: hypothetical protein ABIP97_08690, partial [Chthoniobacterales bacterium]
TLRASLLLLFAGLFLSGCIPFQNYSTNGNTHQSTYFYSMKFWAPHLRLDHFARDFNIAENFEESSCESVAGTSLTFKRENSLRGLITLVPKNGRLNVRRIYVGIDEELPNSVVRSILFHGEIAKTVRVKEISLVKRSTLRKIEAMEIGGSWGEDN